MGIGASVFLIAVGAILAFAVDVTLSGLDIAVVGYILMIAGVVGLIVSLIAASSMGRSRRDDVVVEERRY